MSKNMARKPMPCQQLTISAGQRRTESTPTPRALTPEQVQDARRRAIRRAIEDLACARVNDPFFD